MFLSIVSWVTAFFATLPEYAILDITLCVWTVFHVFVAISHISVADAVYKKTLMQLHRSVVKVFYDVPMLVNGMTLTMTIVTANLAIKAYTNPEDNAITLRAVICFQSLICSLILQKLSISLVKMGVDHVMKMEQEVEKHDIKNWKTPPLWVSNIFAPLSWIWRPEFYGTEHIPTDQPGLYVMNHALYGMEAFPFVATIYRLKNVFLRGLADNMLFGHIIGDFIHYFGGVNGTRDNVDVLMENKDNVLVYPGGGHEVMKSCAVPNYTLMWKQRLGFARVAIKHGYPIVPCASVGTEDMIDRLFDINLEFVRKDLRAPVIAVFPHKLQKVYYWFGEPIPTAQYNGDYKNDEFAKEVRDKAKAAVEAGIKELQERQANDPNRFLFSHMANAVLGRSGATSSNKQMEEIKAEPVPDSKKAD